MRKVSKRKYDLDNFLKKKGISQRILGKLIGKSRAIISQWVNDGRVPLKQLARIVRLTKTKIDAEAKWSTFNLETFRQEWSLTITQLARELKTSVANIRNWETMQKIPRTRLPDVRAVANRCRCRRYRKQKQ